MKKQITDSNSENLTDSDLESREYKIRKIQGAVFALNTSE